MATNGSMISFLTSRNEEKVCRTMSLIDGRLLGEKQLQKDSKDPILFGWVFDPTTLGHICLTSEGLFLFPGPTSIPLNILDIQIQELTKQRELNSDQKIIESYMNQLLHYSIPYIGDCDIPLSISDPTAVFSLTSMLESSINAPDVSPQIIHTLLIHIQTKARTRAQSKKG